MNIRRANRNSRMPGTQQLALPLPLLPRHHLSHRRRRLHLRHHLLPLDPVSLQRQRICQCLERKRYRIRSHYLDRFDSRSTRREDVWTEFLAALALASSSVTGSGGNRTSSPRSFHRRALLRPTPSNSASSYNARVDMPFRVNAVAISVLSLKGLP